MYSITLYNSQFHSPIECEISPNSSDLSSFLSFLNTANVRNLSLPPPKIVFANTELATFLQENQNEAEVAEVEEVNSILVKLMLSTTIQSWNQG